MELTWYGTAALVLREGDTQITFDPFCGFPFHCFEEPGRLPADGRKYKKELRQVRHVFITHGHMDHIYHIPQLYGRGEAVVYGTEAPRQTLRNMGFPDERYCRIGPGSVQRIGSFTVTAWQGRHCRFDWPLIARTICSRRLWSHLGHFLQMARWNFVCKEKGEILFYEVQTANCRVQIMGSMNLDGKTEYPVGADLLVLPFQGRSDQDRYALQFIERLRPKAVVLDHYDDSFPPLTVQIDTGDFQKTVEERYGISCTPLTKHRTIDV